MHARCQAYPGDDVRVLGILELGKARGKRKNSGHDNHRSLRASQPDRQSHRSEKYRISGSTCAPRLIPNGNFSVRRVGREAPGD